MVKRIGILLAILVGLAWFGSVMYPAPPKPAATAQAATAPAPKGPVTPLTGADKKKQQEKMFGAQVITAAKRAVRAELKDPDSAQFKDAYANYTEEHDVVACGSVNAKNGLGGYTGFKRFVSSGKSVIMEGRDDIAAAWAGACR